MYVYVHRRTKDYSSTNQATSSSDKKLEMPIAKLDKQAYTQNTESSDHHRHANDTIRQSSTDLDTEPTSQAILGAARASRGHCSFKGVSDDVHCERLVVIRTPIQLAASGVMMTSSSTSSGCSLRDRSRRVERALRPDSPSRSPASPRLRASPGSSPFENACTEWNRGTETSLYT
jgi:hypothetical protein